MSERIVVDASAGLAILRDEPEAPRLQAALRTHVGESGLVVVPSHFWLEIGNVLVRRYRYDPRTIIERLRLLSEFNIDTVEVDRQLFLLALDRAMRFSLSVYDAAYLALAEAQTARLLTLDADLRAAAGPIAIWIGPHRLAEEAAPYASDPSEVWAEYGGYLAELRREALAT